MLLDLQYKQANRVCNQIILRARHPLDLEELSLAEVLDLNSAFDEEFDLTGALLLSCRSLALICFTRQLSIHLGIVRVQVVAKNLDVVFVGNPECLLHRCALQGCIFVNLAFFHDQMVEVLLYDYAIDCHIIAQIFFSCSCCIFHFLVHCRFTCCLNRI